jgi:6-phosphofructokinase 1
MTRIFVLRNGKGGRKTVEIRKIAVLTSGGDAPGMNAAIRGVTRYAIHNGLDVEGVVRGYDGLVDEDMRRLDRRSVGEIIQRGGTFLRTARCLEFMKPEVQKKAADFLRSRDIDALVVIGGDGSMKGAEAISAFGMPTVVIPGTIDGDMLGTDYTVGFDTAVNTVLASVNKIRDTAFSHDRVAVIEVMGRHAGFIALRAGMAAGAEMVLTPEHPADFPSLCEHLLESHRMNKMSSIIIVAEGAARGTDVVEYIKEHTYLEANLTVLGYVQRGGPPSAYDSLMAGLFAQKAIDTLLAGKYNCVVGSDGGRIVATPYGEAGKIKFVFDENLYRLIHQLGR